MKKALLVIITCICTTWCFGQTFNKAKTTADTDAIVKSIRLGTSYKFNVDFPKAYRVNWDSVKTFDDLKKVMQAMNFRVYADSAYFKQFKKYLIESK